MAFDHVTRVEVELFPFGIHVSVIIEDGFEEHAGVHLAVAGGGHPNLVVGGHEIVGLKDRFHDLATFVAADGPMFATVSV